MMLDDLWKWVSAVLGGIVVTMAIGWATSWAGVMPRKDIESFVRDYVADKMRERDEARSLLRVGVKELNETIKKQEVATQQLDKTIAKLIVELKAKNIIDRSGP